MKQNTPKMNKIEDLLQALPGNDGKTLAQMLKRYYDKYGSWETVSDVLTKELNFPVTAGFLYYAAPRLFNIKTGITIRK